MPSQLGSEYMLEKKSRMSKCYTIEEKEKENLPKSVLVPKRASNLSAEACLTMIIKK